MSTRSLKILIADDDQGDRRQMQRALRRSDLLCECVETESTEQALEICQQREFDCVILDYRLPGLDGLRGISAMRNRFPDLPIIMSTGQGDEMVAADAMKRGASDYIPKANIDSDSIRKSVENAIEKSLLRRKVRQQEEALENFGRVLAHDLRAPGASIQTFAACMAERLSTGEAEQAQQYAEWVIQTAKHMNRLIETLHRYTTVDAKVTFEPVPMGGVLAAVLVNLSDEIQASQAHVTADELPTVLGNAPQLVQLLQNLIGNAIKYAGKTPPRIHLAVSADCEDSCLLSVTDNGIGVPEAEHIRIFEPFAQVFGQDSRKGIGLGLATCKRIVERHRGSIWCESTLGAGSTFFFTLPGADIRRCSTIPRPVGELANRDMIPTLWSPSDGVSRNQHPSQVD